MRPDPQQTPPRAPKHDHQLERHGDVRVDPYYWLREREDQRVLDYLRAENTYTQHQLQATEGLQQALYEEIIGRIKQEDSSAPYTDRGYVYRTRYEAGKEYAVYTRFRGSLDAPEEILLNANERAQGHSYYANGSLRISPNNHLLAYGEDTLGRRIYTLRFKNLNTGEYLPDEIPNTTGSATWANDNQTVFYTVRDEALRPYKIYKHRLGTDPSEDQEVYHETDDTFHSFVYKSKSQRFLLIASIQTLTTEYRILDADQPDGEWRVFQPRDKAGKLEYSIDHYGDRFYLLTNYQAQNFRLMTCPLDATTKEHWEELIPHREDVLLEDLELFRDFLVLTERQNGITRIRVMPWAGEEHYVEFPEDAYLAYTGINREFDTSLVRIGYQSMKTPPSSFDYDMERRQLHLVKQDEILGGFASADYVAERHYAKVRDGAVVPISLVYHRDTPRDRSAPLLLYGYGSYGNSMEPYFSATRLSLLNRGFIFAIAHIRGGEEMGRHWYENGKLLHKKNTFYDFIDCGEYLIQEGYTATGQLYAMGGSAGGLLMGAVMNLRPDLWAGIIAAVPFVDVVTTMLDESIPLTAGEYDEWGNPNDPVFYEYIKSYSPYDNVRAADYPPLLVTTGLHDSQVQYWEPAKWVARLRELKTDDNVLLLHTNMDAGHGGASGRFARHKETAMDYAFLLQLSGYPLPES
ncbi:MAG: S9 family peptidase [Bacteroidota bacterium]